MPRSHSLERKYPLVYDELPRSTDGSEVALIANPYPPLPLSDDEEEKEETNRDEGDTGLYFFDRDGESLIPSHTAKTRWGANILWESSWEDYRKSIGVLGKFPYMIKEAQLLYSILQEGWKTREELIVAALDLCDNELFARSIHVIDWHLQKMDEADLIYKITTYM
jgi:hypothetical protein